MKSKIIVFLLMTVLTLPVFSQFGKNKVQYEDFTWKYIQSENFDIYYNEGSKYLAEFTAHSAEKSLISIQKTLNFRITHRISIVVYDTHNEFQQTNVISEFMPEGVGGVTELFKNRVVIPFQGDYAQLDHVIHHELVHGVLNDMFYGGTFQTAMSSTSGFMIPTWMNEGLAEWESIGGMNTETDMFIRDLTISEKLPPLDYLEGYTAYRGGQTFYWYIADKYGKERVGDLINRLRISKNMDRAFQSTFQMSFKEFSEKWQKDIKKFFLPDLEKYEDPDNYAKKLTNHEEDRTFYNSSPSISPDGKKMAFISAPGGVFGIFVRDIDDKKTTTKLVSSFRQQDFEDLNMLSPGISWNPNGTKLAISAKAGGEDAVFIIDVKSADYDKLTWNLKSISSVQWSYDGKTLAFIASKREQSDIYLYNIEKKQLTNLTNDIFSEKNIVWSNDNSKLYFISDRGKILNLNYNKTNFKIWNYDVYQNDIYEININDKAIERLTFDPFNEKTSIAVTPNNNKILYVSDKNGIGNIYSFDLTSFESKPLTNSLTGITQISLARDGSKLLFTTQANAGYDIYMIRFPLDRKLEVEDLPITKFRQKQLEDKKIIESIVAENEKPASTQQLKSYGDFDIDFSQQKLVDPSVDAQKKNAANEAQKSKIDSDTSSIESEFIENDYKITFSTDVITGNPGFSTFYGFQGVTQMLFSDVLGDHQIFAQANIFTDLGNSQMLVSYHYLPKIIDYSFTVYQLPGYVRRDYPQSRDSDRGAWFMFRNIGLGATAAYPFSLFDRFEVGTNLMYLLRTNSDYPEDPTISKFLIVPNVRYVHDNTLWGYYGPRDGTRYFFDVSGSPKLGNDGVGFVTFTTDLRYYLPLNDYFGFAIRGAGGASFGPNPQNFFLGGTDNWINREFSGGRLPFNNPEDFAFMNFEMPLRGWAVNDVMGNKFFLTNVEFRFPLLTALVAGPVPILIQGINGAIFFDMGGAWNDSFVSARKDTFNILKPVNLLMSSGFGIRMYILGIPLKIDIAWRNEFDGWSEPRYLYSLGFDF